MTPEFPGFTVRTGVGYWKGKAKTVREIVICSTDADWCGVWSIAEDYAKRFGQESVLVTAAVLLSGDFVS